MHRARIVYYYLFVFVELRARRHVYILLFFSISTHHLLLVSLSTFRPGC